MHVGQQVHRPVVRGGVAALDLFFDLAPDTFPTEPEGIEPRPARLFGFSKLVKPFCLPPKRVSLFAGLPDFLRTAAQLNGCTKGR